MPYSAGMANSEIRAELRRVAPKLMKNVEALVGAWLLAVLEHLDAGRIARFPKTINDAVWGTIELLPHEILLVDSPLLQRLRGIRQLGMAHLVYPGAGYDRLEHSLAFWRLPHGSLTPFSETQKTGGPTRSRKTQ